MFIKPVFPADRWSVFFAYCPNGVVSSSQLFSLQRLRDLGVPLLVVATTPDASSVPAELADLGNALAWKSQSGYDFSAYTVAFEAIASASAGATAFVMNDSVFGPFQDITAQAFAAPWDLTGWTGCGKFQNHLQSYAFSLKDVTPARLRKLRSVFFKRFAFEKPLDVILCQETRLARVASRCMSVGALWCPTDPKLDAPVEAPSALLRDGFPFLKKSLLGKYQRFQSPLEMRQWLDHFSHPTLDFK